MEVTGARTGTHVSFSHVTDDMLVLRFLDSPILLLLLFMMLLLLLVSMHSVSKVEKTVLSWGISYFFG